MVDENKYPVIVREPRKIGPILSREFITHPFPRPIIKREGEHNYYEKTDLTSLGNDKLLDLLEDVWWNEVFQSLWPFEMAQTADVDLCETTAADHLAEYSYDTESEEMTPPPFIKELKKRGIEIIPTLRKRLTKCIDYYIKQEIEGRIRIYVNGHRTTDYGSDVQNIKLTPKQIKQHIGMLKESLKRRWEGKL